MKPAATQITVNPSGLTVVSGTDVQTAVEQLDAAIAAVDGGGGGGGGGGGTAGLTNYALGVAPTASVADAGGVYAMAGGSKNVVNGTIASGNKLTDGVCASTGSYGDDGISAAWTADTVLTFDLGTAQSVQELFAGGMFGSAGARMPLGFSVSSSPDNSTWTARFTHTPIAAQGQPGKRPWSYRLSWAAASARYWRVTLDADPADLNVISEIELLGTTP